MASHAEDLSFSEVTPMRGVGTQTPLAKGHMRSLVVGRFHYISNGDGSEELYDIQLDPDETNNLAESTGGQSELVQMRRRLTTLPARRPEHSAEAVEREPATSPQQ
jgi:hypothetical protein